MSSIEGGRLDRAAAFSWRFLVVIGAIVVAAYAISVVRVVAIPVVLAFFLASVLSPGVQWLKRRGWSPLLATWGGIALVVPVIAALVLLVGPALVDGLGPLTEDFEAATDSFTEWLSSGPLDLSEDEIQGYIDDAIAAFQANIGSLTSGLLGGAVVAVEVLTGLVLLLITAFFYLKDGDKAYTALLRRVADPDRLAAQLEAAWSTLSAYVRGLAIVGLVDGTFIGLGLLIVGAPLALPIGVLVFFGSFFPIVGAFITGLLAVSVAFVNGGFTDALIVFGIVLGVQQVEGNVLYPIIFRRVLSLHPLVILLAIAIGGVAFGLVGAFLSVPLTAMAVAVHQATSGDPHRSAVALLRTPVYDGQDQLEE